MSVPSETTVAAVLEHLGGETEPMEFVTFDDTLAASGVGDGDGSDDPVGGWIRSVAGRDVTADHEVATLSNGPAAGEHALPPGATTRELVERTGTSSELRPVLMDIQMVKTRTGDLIKEMAYKVPVIPRTSLGAEPFYPPPDRTLRYLCLRHEPSDVLPHRTVEVGGKILDKYTGLEISCGEDHYSDVRIINELWCYNLIVVKGQNKKRVLRQLFERCSDSLTEVPTVVNVDAATAEEDDTEFMNKHNIIPARFSFAYVYQRLPAYLDMLCRPHPLVVTDYPVYVNNVVATDRRLNVYARSFPLWVCPHDHSCGQQWFSFQRCAALNVGLLETLWFMKRDSELRTLFRPKDRSAAFDTTGRRRHARLTEGVSAEDEEWNRPESAYGHESSIQNYKNNKLRWSDVRSDRHRYYQPRRQRQETTDTRRECVRAAEALGCNETEVTIMNVSGNSRRRHRRQRRHWRGLRDEEDLSQAQE